MHPVLHSRSTGVSGYDVACAASTAGHVAPAGSVAACRHRPTVVRMNRAEGPLAAVDPEVRPPYWICFRYPPRT